jgi:hypothetical protein
LNDFFLVRCRAAFIENARLFVFETYCRIHNTISITMLAEKLNMDAERAEEWIVNLIRHAHLDAKIDSKAGERSWPRGPLSPRHSIIAARSHHMSAWLFLSVMALMMSIVTLPSQLFISDSSLCIGVSVHQCPACGFTNVVGGVTTCSTTCDTGHCQSNHVLHRSPPIEPHICWQLVGSGLTYSRANHPELASCNVAGWHCADDPEGSVDLPPGDRADKIADIPLV